MQHKNFSSVRKKFVPANSYKILREILSNLRKDRSAFEMGEWAVFREKEKTDFLKKVLAFFFRVCYYTGALRKRGMRR